MSIKDIIKKIAEYYNSTYDDAEKMVFNCLRKSEMMYKLENLFDEWEKKEIEDIDSGRGSRGSDGELSKYSVDVLFNEIMWRLK